MRSAVALAVCVLACRVATAAPATGFEHNLHARNLAVRGDAALACARCHAMTNGMLAGKPGHAACFGACHGAPPRAGERPGDRLAVCTACHADSALASPRPAVHYPPYTLEPNFALTVGHERHAALACATCHGAKTAPHRRCAGCHTGARAPAMTACEGCHQPATGAPLPPSIVRGELSVATAFSHARHAARGAACTSCHRAVQHTNDNVLPAPAATTCATARCHDGAAAFPITAACTRCHVDAGPPSFTVARPTARYSHAQHAQVALPCAACHPLSRAGEPAVAGHAPCATCHADDFGRRAPVICGACHNGTEPWRHLVADRGPAERTEFGATLDHQKHPAACTRCHTLTTPARALRPARGHRACTGTACHAVAAGPAPRLTACEGCHRPGLAANREASRVAAPWSVRRAFDHATHARAPTGEPLPCERCHTDVRAGELAALATPGKPTCAPCHDGATAFKLTGTTCTRCHAGAKR